MKTQQLTESKSVFSPLDGTFAISNATSQNDRLTLNDCRVRRSVSERLLYCIIDMYITLSTLMISTIDMTILKLTASARDV